MPFIHYVRAIDMKSGQYVLLALFLFAIVRTEVHAQPGSNLERARERLPLPGMLAQLKLTGAAPSVQTASFRLLERIVENEFPGVPDGKTVYTYENDQRVSEEQLYLEGGEWKPSARTLYRPNSGTLLLEQENQVWSDATNSYEPQQRFEHDVGVLTLSGQWVVNETIETWWDGSGWANVERSTYTYEDRVGAAWTTSETVEQWEDSWQPYERQTYSEDAGRALITTEAWSDGAWVNESRTVFDLSLAELQAVLAEAAQNMQDVGTLLLFLDLPDFLTQQWEAGAWVDVERLDAETKYESGLQVRYEGKTETYDPEAEEWVRSGQVTIDYDENGLPSYLVFESEEDDESEHLYERYVFGGLGELTSAVQGFLVEGTETPFFRYTFIWGNVGSATDSDVLPAGFVLGPAYPNPFNPTTSLAYELESGGPVAIRVYDALGRQVATLFDGYQAAGAYTAYFDAAGLSSGTYLIRMEAGGTYQTRITTLQK